MRTLQISDETFDELIALIDRDIFGTNMAIQLCIRRFGVDSEEALEQQSHLQSIEATRAELLASATEAAQPPSP